MTHLECFRYPVWDLQQLLSGEGKGGYMLFDYSEKDPLTKEARTVELEETLFSDLQC